MSKNGNPTAPPRPAANKPKTTRGGTSNSKVAVRPAATPARPAPPRPRPRFNLTQKALILGIGLIFLAAIFVLSLLSPSQGQMTFALAGFVWRLFGWLGFLWPVLMGVTGFYLVLWGMEQAPSLPRLRLLGFGLLFATIETFASIFAIVGNPNDEAVWQVAQGGYGGGYFGGLLASLAMGIVGRLGAILLFAVLGIFGAALLFNISRADVMGWGRQLRALWQQYRSRPGPASTPSPTPLPMSERNILINRPGRATPPPTPNSPATPPAVVPPPIIQTSDDKGKRGRPPTRPEQPNPEPSRPETPPTAPFTADPAPHQIWSLPTIAEMLESGSDQEINNNTIREQVEIIEHTLISFGAPATVVEISQGPTVTQYGVEPQFLEQRSGKRTKVKVGKIASLADDLALALAAHSVRIQAPVPGKGYVGIEVPNPSKAVVSLRDVMESAEFGRIKSPLRIGLGQNVAGQPIAADLTKMPHLLIAGTTGSGKSVCVNGIIAGLILQNSPEDLKLVMVDPKRVELTGYNGIPHLVAPVVVDMDRVIGTLQWAMREMDNRYRLLAAVGARNIVEYNKKVTAKGEKKLPYIVIFIDELADLMMLSPEDTERGITRLAQMARATGIHMVIATQRPSVDVVTGLIKANFPARIAFAVASSTDSRVILDAVGAERLLGQGDMLFQSPDASAPLRMQGCFVSDRELNRIIEYWRTARRTHLVTAEAQRQEATARLSSDVAPSRPEPPAAAPLPSTPPPTSPPIPAPVIQQTLWEDLIPAETRPAEGEDELLPEAIAMVRQLGKASTSLLQRRFRIGYTRAARLIDLMEQKGVIGPATGTSKAREIVNGDSPPAEPAPETTTEERPAA